jgi:hypothetical protein
MRRLLRRGSQRFNGMVDRRPAVIARCMSERDVIEASAFGLESGLPESRAAGQPAGGRSITRPLGAPKPSDS